MTRGQEMDKRTQRDREVDNEIESEGKNVFKGVDWTKELHVLPRTSTTRPISIRLPVQMIHQLKIAAENKGQIGYQQVIKTYITEGLSREIAHNLLVSTISSKPIVYQLQSHLSQQNISASAAMWTITTKDASEENLTLLLQGGFDAS